LCLSIALTSVKLELWSMMFEQFFLVSKPHASAGREKKEYSRESRAVVRVVVKMHNVH
jgi:hypothetical protein